jgi:hypothetical protein
LINKVLFGGITPARVFEITMKIAMFAGIHTIIRTVISSLSQAKR